MAGKIKHEPLIQHDPLCWIASDYDLVISLTWSERLGAIVRHFDGRWCRDCQRYCQPETLTCPCCERLETDAEQITCEPRPFNIITCAHCFGFRQMGDNHRCNT